MTKLTKEQQKSTSRVFDANNISNPKLLQHQINSKTVMSQLKSAENKNVQPRAKKNNILIATTTTTTTTKKCKLRCSNVFYIGVCCAFVTVKLHIIA